MKQFFLSVIIITIIATGCKKDASMEQVCNIQLITPQIDAPFIFYYGEDNKLKTLKHGNYSTTYEYKNDSIIAIKKEAASFKEKRIYKMNAEGLPLWVHVETNTSGTTWTHYALEYIGTGIKKLSINTSVAPALLFISNYTWSNGNMVSVTYGTDEYTYEYYADKVYAAGDWQYIKVLQEMEGVGLPYIRNKNLTKKLAFTSPVGSYNSYYDYELDSRGKIVLIWSAATVPDRNSSPAYTLQYECK